MDDLARFCCQNTACPDHGKRDAGNFATLDDHAQRLCRELNFNSDKENSIRQEVSALARAGLLLSHGELVNLCRRPIDPQGPVPPITSVGIPTRNRPDSLQRCLTSYIENARQYGRSTDFVVADDSGGPGTGQANRQLLQSLKARYGVAISYAGPEEKARFAEALIRQAGLPADAVNFGLLNEDGCPIATGTSRNALLLHCVGDCLLQVDDDTICRPAPAPRAESGLAFSSQYDPTEFWFLSQEEACSAGDAPGAADFLGVHEQLLGKSLGDCVSMLPRTAEGCSASPSSGPMTSSNC